jgi:hypothetical protein
MCRLTWCVWSTGNFKNNLDDHKKIIIIYAYKIKYQQITKYLFEILITS